MGGELTDYRKALEEHARGVLAQATEPAKAEGVAVETVIAEEDPAQALVEVGRDATRGRSSSARRGEGPLRGALVGLDAAQAAAARRPAGARRPA